MSTEANINTNMFTWAIARAGYSLQDFIQRFPRVEDWINNNKKPTLRQLELFAKKVHLPFGYLFLTEPPSEPLPIPFFRGNANVQNVSINVYDTILLIQQRQDWLREYLKDEGFPPLSFVGRFGLSTPYLDIVQDIRRVLNLHSTWASEQRNLQDTLDFLTEKIESAGIIISFNGVVENNTSRPINVDECRGFVLIDEYAPFMFINNGDSKAAQLFTIVHELAHIWMGKSAGFDFRKLQPAQDPVEILCDSIAAEFLVPSEALLNVWDNIGSILGAARYFKVSEIVIARRALDLGKLTRTQFFAFYDEYSQREFTKKENQSGGGDFYATAKKRLSLAFAGHINNAVRSGKLLYRDAYRLTTLKGDTYQAFFSKHF